MRESLRVDKWLWFARLCKTRTLAQSMIEDGRVTVNGDKVRKANRLIRIGDTIEVVVGPVERTIEVMALGERRGPASEAVLLYIEQRPPRSLGLDDKQVPFHRPRGAGRPTKRDRRALDRLSHKMDMT